MQQQLALELACQTHMINVQLVEALERAHYAPVALAEAKARREESRRLVADVLREMAR